MKQPVATSFVVSCTEQLRQWCSTRIVLRVSFFDIHWGWEVWQESFFDSEPLTSSINWPIRISFSTTNVTYLFLGVAPLRSWMHLDQQWNETCPRLLSHLRRLLLSCAKNSFKVSTSKKLFVVWSVNPVRTLWSEMESGYISLRGFECWLQFVNTFPHNFVVCF